MMLQYIKAKTLKLSNPISSVKLGNPLPSAYVYLEAAKGFAKKSKDSLYSTSSKDYYMLKAFVVSATKLDIA